MSNLHNQYLKDQVSVCIQVSITNTQTDKAGLVFFYQFFRRFFIFGSEKLFICTFAISLPNTLKYLDLFQHVQFTKLGSMRKQFLQDILIIALVDDFFSLCAQKRRYDLNHEFRQAVGSSG